MTTKGQQELELSGAKLRRNVIALLTHDQRRREFASAHTVVRHKEDQDTHRLRYQHQKWLFLEYESSKPTRTSKKPWPIEPFPH